MKAYGMNSLLDCKKMSLELQTSLIHQDLGVATRPELPMSEGFLHL